MPHPIPLYIVVQYLIFFFFFLFHFSLKSELSGISLSPQLVTSSARSRLASRPWMKRGREEQTASIDTHFNWSCKHVMREKAMNGGLQTPLYRLVVQPPIRPKNPPWMNLWNKRKPWAFRFRWEGNPIYAVGWRFFCGWPWVVADWEFLRMVQFWVELWERNKEWQGRQRQDSDFEKGKGVWKN